MTESDRILNTAQNTPGNPENQNSVTFFVPLEHEMDENTETPTLYNHFQGQCAAKLVYLSPLCVVLSAALAYLGLSCVMLSAEWVYLSLSYVVLSAEPVHLSLSCEILFV